MDKMRIIEASQAGECDPGEFVCEIIETAFLNLQNPATAESEETIIREHLREIISRNAAFFGGNIIVIQEEILPMGLYDVLKQKGTVFRQPKVTARI